MFRKLLRSFADVASHHPTGIPKVADKIVWVNVIDYDGNKHVLAGYEGESMLRTLEKFKIDIPASCRGGDFHIPETEEPVDPLRYGPTCAECQIEVAEPWVHYMKPMGVWEKDRITKTASGFMTSGSRLACCFILHKWMNGIQISIPYNIEQKMEIDDSPFEKGVNKIFKV
jgi:ferredoxin